MGTTHQATPPRAPGEDLDVAVDEAVGGMRPGWLVLRDCVLPDGDVRHPPRRFCYALLHPGVGVALVDVAPARTPDAVDRLRRALDAAGFPTAFPGYLPVVYRSLLADDLRRLGDVLGWAFAPQRAIDLPGGAAWMEPVRQALAPGPPGAAAAGQAPGGGRRRPGLRPASVRPAPRPGARARPGFWALALLALGGGAAVLRYLGPPDGLVRVGAGDHAVGAGEEAAASAVAAPPTAGTGWPPAGPPVSVADPEPEDPASPARAPTSSGEARAEAAAAEATAPTAAAVVGPVGWPGPAPDRAAPATPPFLTPALAIPDVPALAPGLDAASAEAGATERGAPHAGQAGVRPAPRSPLPDSIPSPGAPDTPRPGQARNTDDVGSAPAPAEADRLVADVSEIVALRRRLEALAGDLAGGGAANEGRTGGVDEAPIAAEVPARVPSGSGAPRRDPDAAAATMAGGEAGRGPGTEAPSILPDGGAEPGSAPARATVSPAAAAPEPRPIATPSLDEPATAVARPEPSASAPGAEEPATAAGVVMEVGAATAARADPPSAPAGSDVDPGAAAQRRPPGAAVSPAPARPGAPPPPIRAGVDRPSPAGAGAAVAAGRVEAPHAPGGHDPDPDGAAPAAGAAAAPPGPVRPAAPAPPPAARATPGSGVVTALPANVRSGPGGTAPVLRTVSAGARLRVFARVGNWLLVGDAEPWGWMHASRAGGRPGW